MGLKSWLMAVLPFAGMVSLQFLDVGLTTLGKAAMSRGMSHYVFVVYSNALGTLLLLPSFFFNRKGRPPLTYSILFKFFLLSLLGITVMQNCVMTAVNYSSPALGSAMSQLIPAFTFLLAVILRMERLDLGSSKSQIKIVSTIVLTSGALIMILYKGAPIIVLDIQSSQQESLPSISSAKMNNWVLGGFLFAVACLSISINTTYQAVVLKDYPSQTTLVTFYCFFGTIQCVIFSLIAERNPNAWKLRHDIEFISVIYSAVSGTAVTSSVLTWCIRKKGPVFVAMFNPVGIAITAILGVIFLGETLHVGSIIGAVIIVVGFYGVVWSQSKEEEESKILRVEGSRLSSQRSPLLQNRMDV